MIDSLREKYVQLFGNEPATVDAVDRIEVELGVALPADFRRVASFYSGGITGGISHFAIAPSGPADNIIEETKRLRQAVPLPHSFVVLPEPPTSFARPQVSASRRRPHRMPSRNGTASLRRGSLLRHVQRGGLAQAPSSSQSCKSVTNICPGLCVIRNGGLDSIATACGVTPQAQKTGTSPGRISTGSPKSG